MRLPIVTVLLATALMGSYGSASAKPGATFALVITALQNPVKTGSEVKVEIVATNISKREIVIYREIWEGQAELAHYACEVRDDK